MDLRPRLPLGLADADESFFVLLRGFFSVDLFTDSVFNNDFFPEAFLEDDFSAFAGFGVFLPGLDLFEEG